MDTTPLILAPTYARGDVVRRLLGKGRIFTNQDQLRGFRDKVLYIVIGAEYDHDTITYRRRAGDFSLVCYVET